MQICHNQGGGKHSSKSLKKHSAETGVRWQIRYCIQSGHMGTDVLMIHKNTQFGGEF